MSRKAQLLLIGSQDIQSGLFAGILVSTDTYMNIQVRPFAGGSLLSDWCAHASALWCPQLASADEYIDGSFAGNLGEILIRCNNVLYIRELPEDAAAAAEAAPAAAAASEEKDVELAATA